MVEETLSTQSVNADEFKIYPTVLTADKAINIINKRQSTMLIFILHRNGTFEISRVSRSQQLK
jgi:hypothetical protein